MEMTFTKTYQTMARNQLIDYKGKKIYFMDFSNMKSAEEISNLIESSKVFIRSQPPSSILTLTDLTNIHFNTDIKDQFTTFVKGNKPYVKAGCVVGISGLVSIMYNAVMKLSGRNLKAMRSIDEAKDWLSING